MLWPWKLGYGSVKVIGNVNMWYSAYDFLLTFYSNYGSISCCFWDIQCPEYTGQKNSLSTESGDIVEKCKFFFSHLHTTSCWGCYRRNCYMTLTILGNSVNRNIFGYNAVYTVSLQPPRLLLSSASNFQWNNHAHGNIWIYWVKNYSSNHASIHTYKWKQSNKPVSKQLRTIWAHSYLERLHPYQKLDRKVIPLSNINTKPYVLLEITINLNLTDW